MFCFSTDFWSKDAANTDAGVRQNMDIDGQNLDSKFITESRNAT